MTTYSKRFIRIAQLLFSTEITQEEKNIASEVVDMLDKSITELQDWLETVENNLNVFNKYKGSDKSLVVIAEQYEETQAKQKSRYEKILMTIKEAIDLITKIQDIEMREMITNLTKSSEAFTKVYNELTDLPIGIGEDGFLEAFKTTSQKVIDSNQPFIDVLTRIKDYIMKNVLGEQSLT